MVISRYGGIPAASRRYSILLRRHRIAVIEDAAHAPARRSREGRVEPSGTSSCFSFFSNKNLPVGEGGIVVTVTRSWHIVCSCSDPRDDRRCSTWDRRNGHASSYDVLLQGLNFQDQRSSSAAIGGVPARRLAAWNAARPDHVDYPEHLHGFGGIHMPFPPSNDDMPVSSPRRDPPASRFLPKRVPRRSPLTGSRPASLSAHAHVHLVSLPDGATGGLSSNRIRSPTRCGDDCRSYPAIDTAAVS